MVFENDDFVTWANENIVCAVGHNGSTSKEKPDHSPIEETDAKTKEKRPGVCPRYHGLLCEEHQKVAADARSVSMSRVKEALRGERAYDFILASRYVDLTPETWRLAVDATQDEDDLWQVALKLMRFVHSHLTYESQSTHVHTHMREALAERRGVCQDFAHVLLGLCRTLKIPALYVSGYLATEAASATHAWTEVYIPGVGWQGLDPTHNRQPDETYVKIGVGRDYADVPPVSGTYKGTTERKMTVEVKITRGG